VVFTTTGIENASANESPLQIQQPLHARWEKRLKCEQFRPGGGAELAPMAGPQDSEPLHT
jgi:hypothetical protein